MVEDFSYTGQMSSERMYINGWVMGGGWVTFIDYK